MSNLSTKLPWEQANNRWAAQLNPLLDNALNNASLLTGVDLVIGSNTINHKLGRVMQGFFITDIDGAAVIYRSQPFNDLTLTLVSDAVVTINLGVF